jgi:outer membrane protein
MNGKLIVSLFAAFLFPAAAGALSQTIKITVEEAVALGLENSSTLKQKLLAVNAARAGVQSARSPYYPQLTLSSSYTHLFEEQTFEFGGTTLYVGSTDPITVSADLSQNIASFGQTRGAVRIASENVALAETDFEEEKRSLIVRIKRAFSFYLLAGEMFAVQTRTLQYKQAALDVARERYDAGLTPDYELLSAESDLENFRPTVISAENQVSYALLAVKELLGMTNGGSVEVVLIGELAPEYHRFQREELFEKALSGRYDIRRYRNSIAVAELGTALNRSAKRPVVAGFATYSLESGYDPVTGKPRYWGEDSWDGDLSAGVSVRMPLSGLFPWSRENAELVRSTLELEQLRTGLSSLESEIRLDIENILLRLAEQRAKISAGDKGEELASRLYESASERYARGMISTLELQDSQVSLSNARLGRLQAIYDYQIAVFDLMDAVGVHQF